MRAMRGIGNQRHDVVQEGAARFDPAVDLDQVLVVDPGDHHRIDLGQNAARGQHFEAEHLPLVQDVRRLDAGPAPVAEIDPGIDLRADLGIDHVDGDGHVVDVHRRQLVDVVGQREAVGRDAELDVGDDLGDRREGRLRLLPVVAGVARPGDAEHGELRHLVGDRDDLAPRLVGRQLFRDDAGPALVGAIVFAIAVIALDVAGGRDRDMHAREIMVRLLGIAGMVLDPLPHVRVHVLRPGRGTAGRRRTAARGGGLLHRIEVDGSEKTVERDRDGLTHGRDSCCPRPIGARVVPDLFVCYLNTLVCDEAPLKPLGHGFVALPTGRRAPIFRGREAPTASGA